MPWPGTEAHLLDLSSATRSSVLPFLRGHEDHRVLQ
jgi:hypothetical protein